MCENFNIIEPPQYPLKQKVYKKINLNCPPLYWKKEYDINNIYQDEDEDICNPSFNTVKLNKTKQLTACQMPTLSNVMSTHERYQSTNNNNNNNKDLLMIFIILIFILIFIIIIVIYIKNIYVYKS